MNTTTEPTDAIAAYEAARTVLGELTLILPSDPPRRRAVHADPAGQIVVLNGAPRSGKSSIAAAIQQTFEGAWMNLGVDGFMQMTPDRYRPGIGLRPGGERPDLEPLVVVLYRAMYEAIAAHSRLVLQRQLVVRLGLFRAGEAEGDHDDERGSRGLA